MKAEKKLAECEHGIECLEYKVLVRPVEDTGMIQLKGGFQLYKPDQTKERDQNASMEGDIYHVSPFAFSYEQWPEGANKPVNGDRVVFARYSGITVKGADGVDYRLMNDKDIVAIRRVTE